MVHESSMETLYMGTDADFVYRLDQRLAEEGFTHRIRIHRPDTSVAEHATAYLVEVDQAEWRRALETSERVLIDSRRAGEREVATAQAFAADQANKRGRMEVGLIFALMLGGAVGFMAYPMAVKPAVCPWVPPMFPDAPPTPLPLSPPSGK